LSKYKAYQTEAIEQSEKIEQLGSQDLERSEHENNQQEQGIRIDLARNFRSRSEVVDGANAVFRTIMRETVAEMDYDERAELVCGASYPSSADGGSPERYAIEFALLDRGTGAEDSGDAAAADSDTSDSSSESGESGISAAEQAEDLQTVQLEARWIAERIMSLRGEREASGLPGEQPFEPYDGKRGERRPLAWRDIVILLRADKQWAPVMIEELQARGIPAYAELSSGYFEATEVETMLSLLRVIDNPYQDIPLAGALRSPIVGLTPEELALIRIAAGRSAYFDAVKAAESDLLLPESTRRKLTDFLERLERWRDEARRGALADLLWQVFRETGYYDFVGGMPGGLQRQANLRALHDRARQYEATSLRGLFRFLRFVDRMRDGGGDLGTARALGEQEDVVRIMTIHKSKGLEFPVVFVAGLGKPFNRQDLHSPFLMHKQLGFGPRFVDTDMRVSYPTLPYLAIRERIGMETLAEEMRILYVALTRPKEKMILVGTAADASKQLQRWRSSLDAEGNLPDFRLAKAKKFVDWIGPLAMQEGIAVTVFGGESEQQYEQPAETAEAAESVAAVAAAADEGANLSTQQKLFHMWKSGIVPAALLGMEAAAGVETDVTAEAAFAERLDEVRHLVPVDEPSSESDEIERRLRWEYPYPAATTMSAKTSVTEMKRLHAEQPSDTLSADLRVLQDAHQQEPVIEGRAEGTFRLRRPKFMADKSISAAERGTISHLIMQHIPLDVDEIDEPLVQETIKGLRERRMLTAAQAEVVDPVSVTAFFADPVGQRLLKAAWVRRETPFSCTFPAARVYPGVSGEDGNEPILVQGVIDCLFEDESGLVLLDYKTDRMAGKQPEEMAERHRFQLTLYAEAIQRILNKPIAACYIFLLDGGSTVRIF